MNDSEVVMQALEWVQNNYEHVLAIVGGLYLAARVIVKLTPTPKDDEALDRLVQIGQGIAVIFGLSKKIGEQPKK